MTSPSELERLPTALVRAILHRRATPIATARESALWEMPWPLSVAISREVGARGTTVAREVATRLGWALFDNELLQRIADEMHRGVSAIEAVDEKHVSWIEQRVEAFAGVQSVTESSYVMHLVQTIAALGAHGRCVIVGRGASYILPRSSTLRVRLIAEPDDRINAISEEQGISRDSAKHYVEATELQRTRFIRGHFHKDPADPRNSDLLISTSRFSVAHCAELIIAAVERLQSRV